MGRALTTDPNWLLSTSAMSSAALVAIVGGFLVSRVVALSTERQAFDRRIVEIGALLAVKRGELESATRERRAVSEDWFAKQHLNDFIDARGNEQTIEAALAWIPRGSSRDEMLPFARRLCDRVGEAFSAIEATYPSPAAPALKADELRQDGIEIAEPDETVYERVAGAIHANRRPRSRWDLMGAAVRAGEIPTHERARQQER